MSRIQSAAEHVKTVILAGLVVVSLVFSGQLWLGTRYSAPSLEKPGTWTRPSPVAASKPPEIMAMRIVLHFGTDRHSAIRPGNAAFDGLQEIGREVLKAYVSGRLADGLERDASLEELEGLRAGALGIEVLFPFAQTPSGWFDLLASGRAGPNPVTGGTPEVPTEIDRVVVFFQEEPIFFVGGRSGYAGGSLRSAGGSLDPTLASGLDWAGRTAAVYGNRALPAHHPLDSRKTGFPVMTGIYVPDRPPQLPRLMVQSEKEKLQALVPGFFEDPGSLRKLVEHDGTQIVTDGRKGVRLHPSGALDYMAPQGQDLPVKTTRAEAFAAARDFVDYYGGWPPESFVAGLQAYHARAKAEDGGPAELRGYVLEFGFLHSFRKSPGIGYESLPVFSDGPPIQVRLNDQGVVDYERYVVVPSAEVLLYPTVSAEYALSNLHNNWNVLFRSPIEDAIVSDVFFAYYVVRGEQKVFMAAPVWAAVFNNGAMAFIDAHSGSPLGRY